MTIITRVVCPLFFVTALIAGCWQSTVERKTASSSVLRGGVMVNDDAVSSSNIHSTSHQNGIKKERKLQKMITNVINSLIAVVTPQLSERISYVVVKYFDSYEFDRKLGYETSPEVLGDISWTRETSVQELMDGNNSTNSNGTDTNYMMITSTCEEQANIDYKILSMEGAGAVQVESIEFVTNSQNIDMTFDNFRAGAKWSGEWLVKTTFSSLTGATRATMTPNTESSKCEDVTEAQSVDGTIVFSDVSTEARVTIFGETDRIVLFAGTSQIVSGNVASISYDYASVDASEAGVLMDGEDQPVSIAAFVEADGNLKAYLEGLVIESVQREMGCLLPRPLLGLEGGDVPACLL